MNQAELNKKLKTEEKNRNLYGYDCFTIGEDNYGNSNYAHPYITLYRRYGDCNEHTSNGIRIEFQRNLYGDTQENVYSGTIKIDLEDVGEISKLVKALEKKRDLLKLHTKNKQQDYITALHALGFPEIKFSDGGQHYEI